MKRTVTRALVLSGAALVLGGAGLVHAGTAGAYPPYDPDTHQTDVTLPQTDSSSTAEDTGSASTVDLGPPTKDGDDITASSSCSWVVAGTLVVRNPLIDGLENNHPLKGVKVKVSGRSWDGLYNEWGTVTTGADGSFRVNKTECSDRKVKVEAKFDSDDLRVTSSQSVNWYKLFESDSTIAPSTVDLNREPFGGGSGDQATGQARTDAQTWAIYRAAADYLSSIGFPLTGKVTAHNPATLTSGLSAADPILQDIHIDPVDTNDIDAMLHEWSHVVMYQRTQGEGCLTFDAILSGDTHQPNEDPCVAAEEGVAEHMSDMLEQEMNAAGLITSFEPSTTTKPLTRASMVQTFGLVDLPTLGRRDDGWIQVLRVLFSPDVTRDLYGTATGTTGAVGRYSGPACSGQPVGQDDLADLLDIFDSNFDFSTITVSSFLDEAAAELPTFDSTDAANYQAIINPTRTSEPHTLYGC
jgi:hypothetical protein